MKRNTFLKLFAVTVFIEASFFITAIVSTNAAINTILDWMISCCRFVFQNHQIPITFFIFSFLILIVRTLFVERTLRILRRTHKWISSLRFRVVEWNNPIIDKFSKSKRVPVDVVCTTEPYALAYGLFRPRILLSHSLIEIMDEQELLAILEHEYYHCTQKDPIKILFAYGASCSLFFLPVIKHLRDQYFLEKELDADQYAIQSIGEKALASGLYKLLQFNFEKLPNTATVGLNNSIDARIEAIVNGNSAKEKISTKAWILSFANLTVITVLIAALLTSLSHVQV
ncbi:M56 family metallopeptidase [Bacillus gobiensis]|uniref:M56 family metallopeptidase n=1 Tax=Bacillus gobiensis TaxID=1441095 RepID=UPI003D26143E